MTDNDNDIIDLTSDSNDMTSTTTDIHENNNPSVDNDDNEFDDGVSTMHRLGSVACTVREI